MLKASDDLLWLPFKDLSVTLSLPFAARSCAFRAFRLGLFDRPVQPDQSRANVHPGPYPI